MFPKIESLGLPRTEDRSRYFGSSDTWKLAKGRWRELWLEKTRRKPPDDLSGNLAVQLGLWTEEFNRQWTERQLGVSVERKDLNRSWRNKERYFEFCRARTDGLFKTDDGARWAFEAKFTGFASPTAETYWPQLQFQLWTLTTQEPPVAEGVLLSVIASTRQWIHEWIRPDAEYINQLRELVAEFWWHVENDVEPSDRSVAAKKLMKSKVVDMTTTSKADEWCSEAGEWLETIAQARRNKAAAAKLRTMAPEDAVMAIGGGITMKRALNGALYISKEDEK